MELHVSIKSCRGISGIGDKSECFLYASVDWQAKTYYTEVLANTLRPSWRKGNFTLPFSGSLRNQTLVLSIYNCDKTGKGYDTFLGQSLIDLYDCLRFDSDNPKKTHVYDEWVTIEGGMSQGAVVRVVLVAVEARFSPAVVPGVETAAEESVGGEEIDSSTTVNNGTLMNQSTAEVTVEVIPKLPSSALVPGRLLSTRRSSLRARGAYNFKVQVLEACDLMPRAPDVATIHSGVFPNSFCTIVWHGEVYSTPSVVRSLNPKWSNAQFRFPVDTSDFDHELVVYIRDYDFENKTDIGSLGEVKINLTQLELNRIDDCWFPITRGRGMLRVKLLLEGEVTLVVRRSVETLPSEDLTRNVLRKSRASVEFRPSVGDIGAPIKIARTKHKKKARAKCVEDTLMREIDLNVKAPKTTPVSKVKSTRVKKSQSEARSREDLDGSFQHPDSNAVKDLFDFTDAPIADSTYVKEPLPLDSVTKPQGNRVVRDALTPTDESARDADPQRLTESLEGVENENEDREGKLTITEVEERARFDIALRNMTARLLQKNRQNPSLCKGENSIADSLAQYNLTFSDSLDMLDVEHGCPLVATPLPQDIINQKKALLIGCSYDDLGKDRIRRRLGPEMELMIEVLCSTFSFPRAGGNLAILGLDVESGLTRPATEVEVLRGLRWLARNVSSGDILVLYFNGYRSLNLRDVNDVMATEGGGSITKKELIENLYSRLPSGCRLTSLFDYHDRVDANFKSDGSQKLVERDPLSSPFQFSRRSQGFVELGQAYLCPADIRTLAINGQRVTPGDYESRSLLGLSLANITALHPNGLPISELLRQMEIVSRERGFRNIKPVFASTQCIDLDKHFKLDDIKLPTPRSSIATEHSEEWEGDANERKSVQIDGNRKHHHHHHHHVVSQITAKPHFHHHHHHHVVVGIRRGYYPRHLHMSYLKSPV